VVSDVLPEVDPSLLPVVPLGFVSAQAQSASSMTAHITSAKSLFHAIWYTFLSYLGGAFPVLRPLLRLLYHESAVFVNSYQSASQPFCFWFEMKRLIKWFYKVHVFAFFHKFFCFFLLFRQNVFYASIQSLIKNDVKWFLSSQTHHTDLFWRVFFLSARKTVLIFTKLNVRTGTVHEYKQNLHCTFVEILWIAYKIFC